MGERPLTLDVVPQSLLEEFGARAGHHGLHYLSANVSAPLIELQRISFPAGRKLSEESLRDLLPKMLSGHPIDPIDIRNAPEGMSLHHGMHRLRLSLALGFKLIPCCLWRPEDFAW